MSNVINVDFKSKKLKFKRTIKKHNVIVSWILIGICFLTILLTPSLIYIFTN